MWTYRLYEIADYTYQVLEKGTALLIRGYFNSKEVVIEEKIKYYKYLQRFLCLYIALYNIFWYTKCYKTYGSEKIGWYR